MNKMQHFLFFCMTAWGKLQLQENIRQVSWNSLKPLKIKFILTRPSNHNSSFFYTSFHFC